MADQADTTGRRAKNTPVSLFPDDVDRVEAIRRHFGDDSFSKAVRRAVEMVARMVGADDPNTGKEAA